MRRVLIVARREFLQIARTRSFWVTLLIMPLMLVVMPLFGKLMEPPETSRFYLVDATGRYEAAIEQRIDLNHQHQILYDLAAYAARWGLKSPRPEAVWDDGERPFGDDEARAFTASGGYAAALKEAGPLPDDAPAFTPPAPDLMRAKVPADVPVDMGAEAFGQAVGRYLIGGTGRPKGVEPAAAAIYVPADFGKPGVAVRIWTSGGNFNLVDAVRRELNNSVRAEAATAAGLDPATALQIQTAAAPLAVSAPPRGEGRSRLRMQSILPLGIAYFLLISVFTSGAWLLQGVLEERSNKLLEAILACVSPGELMYGKLIGIVGVGFSVIIVWGACVLGMAQLMPSGPMEWVAPALASVNSPWLAVALLFYFVTGYLICASIFLTVGAMCESITDAQAYLSPISLGLFLPFFALGSLISNPDALAAKILSWIPVYTPFAMMARMGVGVEPYEVIGTSILLIAFVTAEVWLLGRVFRASLLRTGQPPKLAELFRLMFKPAAS